MGASEGAGEETAAVGAPKLERVLKRDDIFVGWVGCGELGDE